MPAVRLRDYLAAHAPAEPPDAFDHRSPGPKPVRPDPAKFFPGNEHDAKDARDWFADPTYDLRLSDNAQAPFVAAAEEYWRAARRWEAADHAARLAQWRYAFADAMLEARGQTDPTP